MNYTPLHPDLHAELQYICPEVREDDSVEEAWLRINPERAMFVRGSFYDVLSSMRIYKTDWRQRFCAAWLYDKRIQARRRGGQYPPTKIASHNRGGVSLPNILKI